MRRAAVLRSALLLLAAITAPSLAREPASPPWLVIDYRELIDARYPTHSGQTVNRVLEELSTTTDAESRRLLESLIEPVLEPYAFVLSDAIDSTLPADDTVWVELGALWRPGQAQPAWVELLRSRRYLVESDGKGRLRAFLPLPAGAAEGEPSVAASEAWAAAWPVTRLALGAEARRLGSIPRVEVHAYVHDLEHTRFTVTARAVPMAVESTAPSGFRPPLDLGLLGGLFASGLELEGVRLEGEGALRWLGSRGPRAPTMLGRPVELSDLAVAYRAVFHGGLAEPYMSLDRGLSPQSSIVNYGGRLRDTSLGAISLACDIRFKTFSEGIDIETGRDLREELRRMLPSFRTHLERLSAHPGSAGMAGQQTRLWFYPDAVDLVLSPQDDVLVLRRVRMSAASERFESASGVQIPREDAPWTTATVEAIDRDYDRLATVFPELADLDQVVRLLATCTWLRRVQAEGGLVPELDALLGIELPALSTPREFPQLLAFNALPPAGNEDRVTVYERVAIAEALERLEPLSGRPLPALSRLERARAALDPTKPEHAALLEEIGRMDLDRAGEDELDLAAHRAERLRMHELVLTTLDPARSEPVAERFRAGEKVRVFSVGIGGLDLGMQGALDRAAERSREPVGAGEASTSPGRAVREPREAWRRDPPLPSIATPDHGLGSTRHSPGASRQVGEHRVELGPALGEKSDRPAWSLVVHGVNDVEASTRRLRFTEAGAVSGIERLESGRLLAYAFERSGERMSAKPTTGVERRGEDQAAEPVAAWPDDLVTLSVEPSQPEEHGATPAVNLRLQAPGGAERRSFEAAFPRALLQRLVLGREVDRTPAQPISGLAPLPPSLGTASTVMLLRPASAGHPPWEVPPSIQPGEEDPVRLARALNAWWIDTSAPWRAVVGREGSPSIERWNTAPRVQRNALLLLPRDGFDRITPHLRDDLARAWGEPRTVESLPQETSAKLVVFVSPEGPAVCGEQAAALAASDRLANKLLAVWCIAGPVRADLPSAWLDRGKLAGLGLAESTLLERRGAVEILAELARAIDRPEAVRPQELPGPFLWFF